MNKKNGELFLAFLKIGAITIGGGFAMVPAIHREIVEEKRWVTEERFLQFLTIAQSSPGVMVVNLSLAIGWEINGLGGGLSGLFGAILPSFLSIILVAAFFLSAFESAVMKAFFKGAIPAVSGVIGGVVFVLARKTLKKASAIGVLFLSVAAIIFGWMSPPLLIFFGVLISLLRVMGRQL